MAQEAFSLTPAAGTSGQLTATQWREALLQNISLRCPFFIKHCQAGTTPPSPTTIVLSKPPEISDMTLSYWRSLVTQEVLPEGISLPEAYLILKPLQDSALNVFKQDEKEIDRLAEDCKTFIMEARAAFPLVLKWISKTSLARIERFEGATGNQGASAIVEMDAASLIQTAVLSHSHLDTIINREAAAAIVDQLDRLSIDHIDSSTGKPWSDLAFLDEFSRLYRLQLETDPSAIYSHELRIVKLRRALGSKWLQWFLEEQKEDRLPTPSKAWWITSAPASVAYSLPPASRTQLSRLGTSIDVRIWSLIAPTRPHLS
jgi:hypothetical protein